MPETMEFDAPPVREQPEAQPDVTGDLQQLRQEVAAEAKEAQPESVTKAQEHLKKLAGKDIATDGTVVEKGTPKFKELIGFIQGHANDNPGNANLKEEDVAHMVVLAGKEGDAKGHSIVMAMNAKYELIGFAD